jgi:hypothetical protein
MLGSVQIEAVGSRTDCVVELLKLNMLSQEIERKYIRRPREKLEVHKQVRIERTCVLPLLDADVTLHGL